MTDRIKRNPPHIIWFPIVLSLAAAIGMLAGIKIGKSNWKKPHTISVAKDHSSLPSVDEILRYVDEQYVDSVNRLEIRHKAIQAIVDQLDPHSYFISASELANVREKMAGQLEGIGIEFIIFNDTLVVLNLIEGGAAGESGLKIGDQIIVVEDSTITGKGYDESDLVELIKGPAGTNVHIGYLRNGQSGITTVQLERKKIPINSVPGAFKIDSDQSLYVKVNRFTSNTYSDFVKAVRQAGVEDDPFNLVLDLRHNPGGYLDEAVKILTQIFPEREKLMVYTNGNAKRKEYKTKGEQVFRIDKVAILVDEGSASASEIISAAVQDLDRGAIIGRRTYGKGLVQEQFDLSDGSAIRLTTARYYSPLGRLIQRSYSDIEEYKNEQLNRLESGELFEEEKIELADTTPFLTAKGRKLYSGSGVIPDIFIPYDSIHLYPCMSELYTHFYKYAIDFYSSNDNLVSELSHIQQLFESDPSILNRFLDQIREMGCIEERYILKRQDDIEDSLIAFIGGCYLGQTAFYQLMYENDEAVLEAKEYFRGIKEILFADK